MKRALVLGGGGSKGAYEIGVWKALDELNIHFDIVCGTSIGALIGVLYTQQDYEKAFALWDRITVDDVMKDGVNLDMDIELIMSQKGKYVEFLKGYMHHKGADITPFKELLETLYDRDKFFESSIDYGCMTVNFSKRKPQPMRKCDLDKDTVLDYIIASASCFPAFPMQKIEDDLFIDGGYHDNVPISFAREMGAEEIVAVDLKSVGKNQIRTPQKDTIYIEPFVPLGSFLLFDKERIHRNMEIGYQDTMKKFNRYIGSIYTFEQSDKEAIESMGDALSEALENIDTILERERMNSVVEKVVNHRVLSGLALYKEFHHPFLAILEQCAFIFGIEDVGLQDFRTWKQALLIIADEHVSLFERSKKSSMKDAFLNLKGESELEIICFIYQYLLHEHEYNIKELEALTVLFSNHFLMAYALFALKKDFKIERNNESDKIA